MNIRNHKIYLKDKQNLENRLEQKRYEDQTHHMFKGTNIQYDMDDRTRVIGFGGIGAMHTFASRLGLDRAINKNVVLLKSHVRSELSAIRDIAFVNARLKDAASP